MNVVKVRRVSCETETLEAIAAIKASLEVEMLSNGVLMSLIFDLKSKSGQEKKSVPAE